MDEAIAFLERCIDLLKAKNTGYATGDDPLFNFRNSSAVRSGRSSSFTYCMDLADKQWLAIHAAIKRGDYRARADLQERLMDVAVYMALALVLLDHERKAMANFHDHVCPTCFTAWCHELWDCAIRDGSQEALCPQCSICRIKHPSNARHPCE